MSNSLFGNPKIALGFAGGVVAIALVASMALDDFKPGSEEAAEPAAVAAAAVPAPQAAAPPAQQGFADGGAGWGDAGGAGWGAAPQAAASGTKPSFTGPSAADPFADIGAMDNKATRNAGGRKTDRSSSGPTITSSAAPGAPEVISPRGESRGTLKTSNN